MRHRNDTDVLIETYTIRIQNHKAKIKIYLVRTRISVFFRQVGSVNIP